MTRVQPPQRPSMQDVARLAGVSAQTVSRVLGGHPYVSEKKRRLVADAVSELGYTLNSPARALSSGRTRTIGVVAITSDSYASAKTLASIESAADAHDYRVASAYIAEPTARSINSALQRLEKHSVEGVILAVPLPVGAKYTSELLTRVPTATIGGSTIPGAHSLDVDQAEVARLATQHLLDLGHRTVWHVTGPGTWVDASDRIAGWKSTLERANRRIPELVHGDWSPQSGFDAGVLLGENPDVTAIFVANDEMAFGLISGLRHAGKRVPDDVSIVSVDDIGLAAYCTPPLTTVAQPFSELSVAAVQFLVESLGGVTPDSPLGTDSNAQEIEKTLIPRLIVRKSTRIAP